MSEFAAPVVLEGRVVRLEPLGLGHTEELLAAAADPSIWTYLMIPQPTTIADMKTYIGDALSMQEKRQHLPLAVVRLGDGKTVGTTRYLDIQPANKALEIGWTWYAKEVQRTAVNTECKYLLLKHAFEELGCHRVQLKTDALNACSRRAIERIGGQFEGILRKYQTYWHGRVRDTAMYSIIEDEWPDVKAKLQAKMGA